MEMMENAIRQQPEDVQNYAPPAGTAAAEPANGAAAATSTQFQEPEDSKPAANVASFQAEEPGEEEQGKPDPTKTSITTDDAPPDEPQANIADEDAPSNGVPMVYDPAADPMMVSDDAPKHVPPAAAPPPAKKRRTGTKRSAARPWNDMLFELLKYRLMHGNIMVPFKSGGELGAYQVDRSMSSLQLQLRDFGSL